MNSSGHSVTDPHVGAHHHSQDMGPPSDPSQLPMDHMSHDESPVHHFTVVPGNLTHHDHHGHHGDQNHGNVHHGDSHHGDDLLALLNIANFTGEPSCLGTICIAEKVIVVMLPLLIIFGNVVTITVLLKNKSFRNCHGYYLLSLAFADLLMGPATITAIFPVFYSYWPFGVSGCLLTAYIGEVCMKVSLLTLLLLSIERYIAICHPFYYTRLVTTKTTVITIVFTWAFCNLIYIVTIPPAIICFTYSSAKYMCTVTYFMHPEYVIGIVMTFLVPSLVAMTVTTALSSYQIFQSQIRSRPAGQAKPEDRCEMRVHSKKNKRVFVVLLTLLLAFYVCWLPYVTINIYAYASGNSWDLNHHVEFYSTWLAVANSCLNPMIYFGLNKTFKRASVELIRKLLFKATFGKLIQSPPESIVSSDTESKMKVISGKAMESSKTESTEYGICNRACEAEMETEDHVIDAKRDE